MADAPQTLGIAPWATGSASAPNSTLPASAPAGGSLGVAPWAPASPQKNDFSAFIPDTSEKPEDEDNPWQPKNFNKLSDGEQLILPITDWWRQFNKRSNEGINMLAEGRDRMLGSKTFGGKALGLFESAGGAFGALVSPLQAALDEVSHIGVGAVNQATGGKALEGKSEEYFSRLGGDVLGLAIPLNPGELPKLWEVMTNQGMTKAIAEVPYSPLAVKAVAAIKTGANYVANQNWFLGIRSVLSPTGIAAGQQAAVLMRNMWGTVAAYNTKLRGSFQDAIDALNRLPYQEQLKLWADRVNGVPWPKELQPFNDALTAENTVMQARYEQMFPGSVKWRDPARYLPGRYDARASEEAMGFGGRSVHGPRQFRQQKTYETPQEAIAAGLIPESGNPFESAIKTLTEMEHDIQGEMFKRALKESSLIEFRTIKPSATTRPNTFGVKALTDPTFTAMSPAEATQIRLAFDQQIRDDLAATVKKLGFTHERGLDLTEYARKWGIKPGEITPSTWGFAVTGGTNMASRMGGPDMVIAHEFGHLLDFKYDLARKMLMDPTRRTELFKLALERIKSQPIQHVSRKYINYLNQPSELMANMVHGYLYAQRRMKEIAPESFKEFERIIGEHPELADLKNIHPGFELGSETATIPARDEMVLHGRWYAPEHAATVINNAFEGARVGTRDPTTYIRRFGNMMGGLQLALSAFHLTFTTLDTIHSKLAMAIWHAEKGEGTEMFKQLLGLPFAPVTTFMKGRALEKAGLNPALASPEAVRMLNALAAGGGRVLSDRDFQVTNAGPIWHDLAAGTLWRTAINEAERTGSKVGATTKFIGRLLDSSNALIMRYVVPRQKLGVYYDMAADIMKRNPGASMIEMAPEFQKAWDSVDNRLGLMVYDNLAWSKFVRTAAHMSMRAVGWNLGTIREVGGGLMDTAEYMRALSAGTVPEMTRRMAYTYAMVFNTALIGGIYTWLATGKPPQDARDLIYPRTGRKDPRTGGPERISYPGYHKDIDEYNRHPLDTIVGKLNPGLTIPWELLTGTDYRGASIVGPRHEGVDKLKDYGRYMFNTLMPFAVRPDQLNQRTLTQDTTIYGINPLREFGIQRPPVGASDPQREEALQYKFEGRKADRKYMKERGQERRGETAAPQSLGKAPWAKP